MSILTELKKLTKKKNATVVSQALPDEFGGGSGSSGGGGLAPLMVDIIVASLEEIPEGYDQYAYLSATWQEIMDALLMGRLVLARSTDEYHTHVSMITNIRAENVDNPPSDFLVEVFGGDYVTSESSGHPGYGLKSSLGGSDNEGK